MFYPACTSYYTRLHAVKVFNPRKDHRAFCGILHLQVYSMASLEKQFYRIKLPQHKAAFCKVYQHCFSRPPMNLTYEERMAHEQLDVKMIRLIQEQILPRASHTPPTFISHVMTLLNRGSVHATSPQPLTTGEQCDIIISWIYCLNLRCRDRVAFNSRSCPII